MEGADAARPRRPGRVVVALAGLVGSELSALVAGFAATVLIARVLGPSGRGVVALATTSTVFAAAIGSVGLSNALAVEAGKGGARTAAPVALGLTLAVGIPLAIVWGAVGVFGESLWQLKTTTAGILFATGCLLLVTLNMLRGVLIGTQEYGAIARGRVVFAVLLATLSGALAAFGALTATSAIAASFFAVGGQAAWYWTCLDRPNVPSLPRKALKAMTQYAIRSQPGMLFQTISYRYDLILVGALLTTTDAGLYAVALALAELGWLAIDAAGIIVLGRAVTDRKSVTAGALAIRATVVLAGAQAIVLLAVTPILLPLAFGDAFSGAYPALAAMLPGVVALGAWRVAMNDAAGRGRPGIQSISASVGAAAALPLQLWTIPTFGIAGAGAASSISYGLTSGMGIWLYSRAFGVAPRQLIVPSPADMGHVWRRLVQRDT